MGRYEVMTIVKQNLGEEGVSALSNSIKDLISSLNGRILDTVSMGKRKYSYEVKGEKEGYYDVVTFELSGDSVLKLKEKLNRLSGLVRYLITAQ